MKKNKVLIVDDHPLTRAGVRSLLESNSNIDIIGEAKDGLDAVMQTREKKPDIVIMDITMPQLSGIDATREILEKQPDIKIIAFSIHSGQNFVKGMLNAGAVGYLLKEEVPEELLIAIEKVLIGDMFLSSTITRAALAKENKSEEDRIINILASKLHRPPVLPDYVVRSKIILQLESNVVKPLSLISAGAGYGKSGVASQWLEQTKHHKSWITLGNEHNDLRNFLSYLVASIEKVFPGMLKNTKYLVSTTILPSVKNISNTLINELCDIDEDLILVLDDYHHIKEGKVHELINDWLHFPPPHIHLCIITRRDPPLNIRALRLAGRMTEIRMEDLSFTNSEISEFYNQIKHIDLSTESIEILHNKTEGWVLALRLFSMIMNDENEIDQVMKSGEGELRSLSEYLLSEVLNKQPQHVQDQLIKTSILNRFCGELIDEVCNPFVEDPSIEGVNNNLIQWLYNYNLFVVPLDTSKQWFRYHHLFQEFLQDQLKNRLSNKTIADLHLKASNWFEKESFLDEAMYHALLIGANDRAVEIIKTHRMILLNKGKWQLLTSLYRRLPKSVTETDPELLLVEAYISFYLADHKKVGEIVDMIEPLMGKIDQDSILHAEYEFFIGYVTMYLKKDAESSLKHFKTALREIPESASYPRALVELFYPMFSQMAGRYTEAINWLEKIIDKSENFVPIRKDRLLLSLLLTSTSQGDLDLVERYYMHCLSIARENEIDDSLGNCLMVVGELFLRRGEWKVAIGYFEEVLVIKYNVHIRCVIDCMTGLVSVYGMLGDHEKCKELIKELHDFTKDLGDYYQQFYWSCKIRYHILTKDVKKVRELLFPYSPDFVHLVFWIDIPDITFTRALIFEGSEESLTKAEEELSKLDKMTSAQHNRIHLLEVYALQALLYDKLGDAGKAQEKLIKSIELAEPGRVVTFYVELGAPLKQLIQKMPDEIKERPLLSTIDKIMKSIEQIQLDKSKENRADKTRQNQKLNLLTPREIKVLECIAEGLRNQEIAEKLFNSEETIKKHIYHMFQKLGVKNRMSLVSKAKEEGILT